MPIVIAIAALAVIGLFRAGAAFGEPLEIGGGLTVDPPEALDLTFQIIPSYDDKKEVLAGWNGKTLQYFIRYAGG